MKRKVFTIIAAAVAGLVLAGPSAAQVPQSKCASGKEKCVRKLLLDWFNCYSKANAKPDQAALDLCVQKATEKFTGGVNPAKGCFAKLEAKPPCLTTGDRDEIFFYATSVPDVVRSLLDPDPMSPPATLSKCTSGQLKCARMLAADLVNCNAKNTAKPNAGALSTCLTKAFDKFTGGPVPAEGCFAKLEAKMPNDCVTTGRSNFIRQVVDTNLKEVVPLMTCGDGAVGYGEECENTPPNRLNGDGCSFACRLCGNGLVGAGESCDDGNTDPLAFDSCPGNCVIEACAQLPGPPKQVEVNFSTTHPSGVAAILVGIDYPEGKVGLGTTGLLGPSRFTETPPGTTFGANNLGYGVKMSGFAGSGIIPVGKLAKFIFSPCDGALPVTSGEFSCTVLSAADPTADLVTASTTCTVTVLP